MVGILRNIAQGVKYKAEWFFWLVVSETIGRIVWGTQLYCNIFYNDKDAKEAYECFRDFYKQEAT